jgi:hypothetical protein
MLNLPAFLAVSFIFAQITPDGRESAPKAAPVEARVEEPVRYQPAIAPFISASVASYPDARKRFQDGLPRKTYLFVSVRLGGGGGPPGMATIRVSSIDDRKGLIYGRALEDVKGRFGIRQDDDVTVHEADVIDWKITHPDGSAEGDAVGKYIAALGPDANPSGLLLDQRDKDLNAIEGSKTVDAALNQTFLDLFGDKNLRVQLEPSVAAPAVREWRSLATKYFGTSPTALVAELGARAEAIKATRKVAVEKGDIDGRDLVTVTAFVVLRKGDVVFEVTQDLQFFYSARKELERVDWGLRVGRWIMMAPKAK